MLLTPQLGSLFDEKTWGMDSFARSGIYKVQDNFTSYGTLGGLDNRDYYAITPGLGTFALVVTTDPANGFATSRQSSGFDVTITDSLGRLVLTSTVVDLYTRGIAFTSTGYQTYYVQIDTNSLSTFAYAVAMDTVATAPPPAPTDIAAAALLAFTSIMRHPPTSAADASYFANTVAQINSGALPTDSAVLGLINYADASTSVATLAYQFFTGKIPSAAGLDYLVSPTGPNPNNLNSAYYQSFNLENRYINFAVNLGKLGEGQAKFQADYGNLSLIDATAKAYAYIFGAAPTDAKVHALVDPRADYFAYYGQDGANGIGTKAAMVGWLLAEATKADVGSLVTANMIYLADLSDGEAPYSVDLIGVYGGIPITG